MKQYIGLGTLGFMILISGMFLLPEYERFQKRKYAKNEITINEITINQTQQLIEVEKKKAQIRIETAKGVAEAQKIIDRTLSDKYLQLEAIQAQMKMAGSPNHTQIYIPTGQNGIPIIRTIDVEDDDNFGAKK